MKAVVKTYLNIRTGAPAIEFNNNPGYYNPGDEVEILQPVVGEMYKENCIWYLLKNGAFVWSGGIISNEVVFDVKGFKALDMEDQYQVLLQAKMFYGNAMLFGEYGVTGMFIGHKHQGGIDTGELALCFQVKEKAANVAWKKIPELLTYYGFALPTDVEEAPPVMLQVAGDKLVGRPGGSLSRINRDDWGSCAFIAESQDEDNSAAYLVTNYHVAALDLIQQNVLSYNIENHDDFLEMVMPSWIAAADIKNNIGFLSKGLFDEWHDTAIIELYDAAKSGNTLPDNKRINAVTDVVNKPLFIGQHVTMYGALSGKVINKKIVSVNSTQLVIIGNKTFKKSELIQTERMSDHGDSGSPVLVDDQLIGIILGADDSNSYLVSAAKIIRKFNLKLSVK